MSAPITLDLAGIRARAEAATPGPWSACQSNTERGTSVTANFDDIADDIIDNDADHIAGMDPLTTLALVDEMERLTRERDEASARSLDSNMLAHKWMVAHDLLKAGEPYDTPHRIDLPDSIARADAAEAEAAKLRARVAELEGENKLLQGIVGGYVITYADVSLSRAEKAADKAGEVATSAVADRAKAAVLTFARTVPGATGKESLSDIEGRSLSSWLTVFGAVLKADDERRALLAETQGGGMPHERLRANNREMNIRTKTD